MAGSASPAELLDVAREAARRAGDLLLEAFEGPASGVQSKSTPTDLVSEADLAAERAIRELLAERRPHDTVLGEEGGEQGAGEGLRWVVDPLDGTVNFLFGIPQWSVSVACEDGEGAIVGVVLDPLRSELFAATRDGEATLNGRAIAGSGQDELSMAMVVTGFAYDAELRARQADVFREVLPRVRDVRRLGSAALDLAWTACGRCDAYYERGLNDWDLAAGALICGRAGLEVRELRPADGMPGGLAVAPGPLIDGLLELVGP